MRSGDVLGFALHALRGFRLRSALMMLAMAIGVAAVVMLTALGEGARGYVTNQFAALGTHLLIVIPGRAETSGSGFGIVAGTTPRDLTVGDAEALMQSSLVARVAPLTIGTSLVSAGGLEREGVIFGTNHEMLALRHWEMAQGEFLPVLDLDRGQSVCVLGGKVRRELFGAQPALGEWLRIGDRRFRVIGILKSEGRSIGVDVEDLVIIPVASAQALFNSPSLFRILVQASSREAMPKAQDFIRETIKRRHQGEEDVTVVAQDAVLGTFDKIFRMLTFAVAGIAAISLAVAGILVMNVMLVAVAQRTREIGLLKALGAAPRLILALFLLEAILLSLLGACAGLAVGELGSLALRQLYPDVPMFAPHWALYAGFGVALVTGVLFGILPARRAARLDPVQALSQR